MADSPAPHEWTELRIGLDRDAQDALITELAPQLRAVTALGGKAFLIRETGESGPCLRLRLHGAGDPVLGRLAEQAMARGGDVEPPRRDRPLGVTDLFAGPAADPLVSEFLAGSMDLLLDGVEAVAGSPGTRLALALDLMLAQLPAAAFSSAFPDRYPGIERLGYPLTFLSLRSHADGFFITCPDPAAARAGMERRYQQVAPRVRTRLRLVLDSLAALDAPTEDRGAPTEDPHDAGAEGAAQAPEAALRWHRLARPYLLRADAELRQARLWFTATDGRDLEQGGYLGDERDISVSRFHETVQASGSYQRFMRTDPGFGAMRVLMSLLYLFLHCLGLTIADRYFLCHAVSRACEEEFGVDAARLLTQWVNAVDEG